MLFVCPKCKRPLAVASDGRAVCGAGHSYDRAKEGYYNLLLKNTGGTHGDNKEMVLAREAFLNTGAYLPLATALHDAVFANVREGDKILDGGCGEGYYTSLIENFLFEKNISASVSGFDISKEAVRRAAKRNPRLSLAVASSYDIPVCDGGADLFINVFSPLAIEETARVLRSGGKFIMAIPDENHLFGLKRVLYERPYKNTVENTDICGFKLLKTEKIKYTLSLDTPEKIRSLFMMTPYAYRTPPKARERLSLLDRLDTEIEFILFTYEKEN